VNQVGAATLGELPGITPGVAQAIIAGRPYRVKRELLTRRVLTEAEYERWKTYLVVHRGKPGGAGRTSAGGGARQPS
jgi:DNA uptake protein ComE-like DNA-binding protein